MTTKMPRLNIVIDDEILSTLEIAAESQKKSMSAIAKEILIIGLEKNEDIYFSKLAEERDEKNTNKKKIKHKDAWK